MRLYKNMAKGIVALALGGCGYIMLRAAEKEYREGFRPYRNPDMRIPEAHADLDLQIVNLNLTGEEPFTALYKRPKNGAVVILVHGSEGDRNQLLAEAEILIDQGFGILSLDLPGHGASGGETSWGDPQQKAIRSSLDWLETQRGAEKWTFGIFGFSLGAWSSLMAAVHEQRFSAVGLVGAFASYEDMIQRAAGNKGWLVSVPMIVVDYAFDFHFWNFRPLDIIGNLHQPLLVMAGDQDVTVPLEMSQRLYNAAPGPKYFVLIEGAGHGTYLQAQPLVYRRAILRFFEQFLLKKDQLGEHSR